MSIKEQINKEKLPNHLAIIMDGNGRWAKQQGLLRAIGHENGTKSVRQTVEASAELGIKNLTLYAFSTENWNRPKLEVQTLMKLLVKSLKKEIKTLQDNGIRLCAIGCLGDLPKKAHKELLDVIENTKNNTHMTLTLALSYGSREEIVNVVKELSFKVKNNIIRTSGEQRISNFLLWQIAYAELYFTDILWPDFKKEDLYEAIVNYQNRERRFGKTSEQLT